MTRMTDGIIRNYISLSLNLQLCIIIILSYTSILADAVIEGLQ